MAAGMTARSRLAVTSFWEYAAFLVNSIVFLLIGIEADAAHWWEHPAVLLVGIPIVLVGRAIAVYGLSALLRGMDRSLPFAWQHLLVWGGLRGALCLALALGLPSGLPFRERIVSMTFGYVLFSLLVQGLTVDALIKRLGIAIRPLVPPDRPGREVDQPE
jgi:CPA1 family monovalent cation:H+ antiporter